MKIHLTDHEVSVTEDYALRSSVVVHRVTATTSKGEWSVDFTYHRRRFVPFDPKRLHYHLNMSRNKVTRAAIEKEYGD